MVRQLYLLLPMNREHSKKIVVIAIVAVLFVIVFLYMRETSPGTPIRTDAPAHSFADTFLETFIPENDIVPTESYTLVYTNSLVRESVVSFVSRLSFTVAVNVYKAHLQDLKWALVNQEELQNGFISMYFQRGKNDLHVVFRERGEETTVSIFYIKGIR